MKNAVLISPPFFHYEDHIKFGLESRGYNVFYINHKKNKFLDAYLYFKSIEQQADEYSKLLMKRIQQIPQGNIELLFVIKGDFLSSIHIQFLKNNNPNIRCIMYQWDSVNNFNYLHLISQFDEVYTFDFHDSRKFNIKYLSLFYTHDISAAQKHEEDIDFLLIGTFNTLRYKYYQRLQKLVEGRNMKLYAYLLTPFSYYVKNQIIENKLHIQSFSDIRFLPMSREKLIEYYSRAKVIVDVCKPTQTGLSMRMIESYGMNKKVLTANQFLEEDPNLKEIMSLNIDADDEQIIRFLNLPVNEYINKRNVSIDSWLTTVLKDTRL